MNPKKHIAWQRWCSAAVVAAGAISFAAVDASAHRIYVQIFANGGNACTPPWPQQLVGEALATNEGPWGLHRCNVLGNVQSGTTVSLNSLCTDFYHTEVPYWTKASLSLMDYNTGEIQQTLWMSGVQPWGTAASVNFDYNGCSGTVLAQGRN
jgi:hypothetical protein